MGVPYINWKKRLLSLFLVCALAVYFCQGVAAQADSEAQQAFWPELDVYVKINPKWRLMFFAYASKELAPDDKAQGQVGAHVDYLMNRRLSLRAGYRYGLSFAGDERQREHRILFEQTARQPLPAGLLLSDRNRQELRIINGNFSVRYRNRVTLEREFAPRSFTLTPYAAGEIFYDTRYQTFNRNRLTAGVKLPLLRRFKPFNENEQSTPGRSLSLDLYFARQNDSRPTPERVNALGVRLIFGY
jgi:hypothetical protein